MRDILNERIWTLKLTITGDQAVGKTSLRRTYLGEKFEGNYLSTIGADFSFKQVQLENNDVVNTAIWDLAGQDTYEHIHPQYFKSAAGCIVVYDVTDDSSFESISKWIDRFFTYNSESKSPVMIFANKTDLVDEDTCKQYQIVLDDAIKTLQENYPNRTFLSILTSAKTGDNVSDGFIQLIEAIMANFNLTRKPEIENITEDMDRYLRAAYIITFHDLHGPQIIAKSPIGQLPYQDEEFSSAIKISAVIDFEDVATHTHLSGTFPWLAPRGYFTYIAFTIDNPEIDGNKGLYIIGVVEHHRIRDFTSRYVPIITGYLHQAMNEFTVKLSKFDSDFITQQMDTSNVSKNHEISDILYQLRNNIFDLIKSDLE